MEKRQPWYALLRRERLRRSWSQGELAEKIGSVTKTVSRWESGKTQMPGPFLRRKIAEVFEMRVEDLGLVLEQEEGRSGGVQVSSLPTSLDWSEAPRLEGFVGRERELQEVGRWMREGCQVVAIVGIGGVGKTALATMVARQQQNTFQSVYWRSLQHAPTPDRFLEQYLHFAFDATQTSPPADRDARFSLLLASLRVRPCLLVLDNFESVFSEDGSTGKYRPGYEGYGDLLNLIGEADHASCLLLTSREKPGEIARLEGFDPAVRSLHLGGLDRGGGQALLEALGLHAPDEAQVELLSLYAGNPLALKLVAEPIRELFGGNITSFLGEREAAFGTIAALIEEQLEPLGEAEQEVLYWLAVEREEIAVHGLRTKLRTAMKGPLLGTVEALRRRSLVEAREDGGITLQPVVMEYVTRRLVERVTQEILAERVALLDSYALVQAKAKDYVRVDQEREVLGEVARRLTEVLGREGAVKKLQAILTVLRTLPTKEDGYAAANVLHLLIHLRADLCGSDFSALSVRQAYLQGANLTDTNFAHAHFAESMFTDTFSSILCVALSADGTLLAAGTTSGEVRLWEAETLTPLFACHGHADGVRSVAFSPDGRQLVSGSEDFTLRLWDTGSGRCLRVLQGHTDQVYGVTFSPDGWTLASASEDQTIRTWDAATGRPSLTLTGHNGRVRSVAFSNDGNVLASGGEDAVVRLWDVRSGSGLAMLRGHEAAVRAVVFSPRGAVLASAGQDGAIRLWKVGTAECIRVLRGHTDLVRALTFSADGNVLASSSDDQTISLWNVEAGLVIKVLYPQSNRIWSLAFFPDSSTLISAGESAREDDTLRYWDIRRGQCTRKLRGYCSLIKSVAFSPDGKTLVSGSEENELRVWDVASRRCIATFIEHLNRVRCVAFSSDGRMVASGSEDETVRIWDIQAGLTLRVLRGHNHLVRCVAFSPDSRTLASVSFDGTIRLWDTAMGGCLQMLRLPGELVWSVAFSPDGTLLASGNDDHQVYLWDTAAGTIIAVLRGHSHHVRGVAFSPDSRTLASASDDRTLRTWDVRTGQCLRVFKGHELWVRSVAYSLDGTLLASGSHDHSVRIWDTHTGRCISTLQGHEDSVWCVAFSPDGRTLASCGDDGTIRLWDQSSLTCLAILHSEWPYERMNIWHATGLTEGQRAALLALGACEEDASH